MPKSRATRGDGKNRSLQGTEPQGHNHPRYRSLCKATTASTELRADEQTALSHTILCISAQCHVPKTCRGEDGQGLITDDYNSFSIIGYGHTDSIIPGVLQAYSRSMILEDSSRYRLKLIGARIAEPISEHSDDHPQE